MTGSVPLGYIRVGNGNAGLLHLSQSRELRGSGGRFRIARVTRD